jgi:hypothetical protein
MSGQLAIGIEQLTATTISNWQNLFRAVQFWRLRRGRLRIGLGNSGNLITVVVFMAFLLTTKC